MNKDQFWSIDKLIPRVGGASSFAFEKKNDGVLIQNLIADETKTDFGPAYYPKNSKVIRNFQLTEISQPENDFILRKDGKAALMDFVPCNAFSPSFLALKEEQRSYFYYFCDAMAEGKKIPTAFPYLQLYLCRKIRECLPQKRLSGEIFAVWKSYRKDFPLADRLFCDIISDFSFLTKTKPPYELLGEIFTEQDFRIRPFLLDPFLFDYLFTTEHQLTQKEMDLVLRMLTGESFRKSKAYRMHPKFSAVVEDAVHKAFKMGIFNRNDLNASLFRIQIPSEVRVERQIFPGLPQEEIPKGKIGLCYVPLLHDENIRSRFDEIIRYLENRIRKILKMKNSLSRIHISAEHRAFLEGIISEYEYLAPKENESSFKEIPNEKKKIEPRTLEIDFNSAEKIEEDSWILTQSLTEAYTGEDGENIVIGSQSDDENFDETYQAEFISLENAADVDEGDFWEFAGALTETEDAFMRVATNMGASDSRKYCLAKGMFFEAMIASCNQKAQDTVGDSIFDGAGNLYVDDSEQLKTVFPPLEGED